MVKARVQKKREGRAFTKKAWAIVIVTPELRRSRVFTKGSPQTWSDCVSTGGHTSPIRIEGERLT